jgi:hypothetical protein
MSSYPIVFFPDLGGKEKKEGDGHGSEYIVREGTKQRE